MGPAKIVVIGACSVVFTLRMFQDLLYHRESLKGSTIVLVDIDENRLKQVADLANHLMSQAGSTFKIQQTTRRAEALTGADYVLVSVEIDRDRLWQLDWEIPLKHGIRHVLGENAGPGGLSHTLRTVPLVLRIAQDIESICPDAWVINLTNPESRVCLGLTRHTSLKVVGLCHGIGKGFYIAAHLLGMIERAGPWPDEMQKQEEAKQLFDIQAAGINHFTWILSIRDKQTGRDLYPDLRKAGLEAGPDFHPLSRYFMKVTGWMLATGDRHAGELIGYADEFVGLEGHDFNLLAERRKEFDRLLHEAATGSADLSPWLSGHSVERAVDFIAALHGGPETHELSANLVNRDSIANLPANAIVEVPANVDAKGIHSVHVGDLPPAIAAMCSQQIAIQELAVEAAVTGDRRTALQALLIDPVVPTPEQAENVLDELLTTHAAYLPQFQPVSQKTIHKSPDA